MPPLLKKPKQRINAKHRRKFFVIELDENTLLLCSDGLTIALSDEELREVIIFSKTEDVCKKGCAGKI